MPDLWYWGPEQGMVLKAELEVSSFIREHRSECSHAYIPNLPRGALMFI